MSGNAIALAAICVLVVVVIYQYSNNNNNNGGNGLAATMPPAAAGAAYQDPRLQGDPRGQWGPRNDPWDPHTGPWSSFAANQQQRTWPNSKMSQRGLAQSGVDRDRIADAEREAWYSSGADVETFATDPSSGNYSADPSSSGDPSGMDYARYTTDSIVDPRMRENHRKWVEEMGPWSGSLRPNDVDDMNEALEASTHFSGLRRPQQVPVDNPTQVTELGPEHYSGNGKFRFNG
jgi:hypothetical protein